MSADHRTFAELGVPFPLFDAFASEASEYVGRARCSICAQDAPHAFRLDIGCALMVTCPSCALDSGLDTSDATDGECRGCGERLAFPAVDDEITTCYACLRDGRAAISKDTELGMISWEQAFDGVTHGVPALHHPDFEMVPQGDGWFGAKLPQPDMFELLRTPTFSTIQGERWLFCCRRPMTYVGSWSRDDFTRRSPDGDGRAYFDTIVQNPVPGLWEDNLHDITGIYVFRCLLCERLTANWDIG